jgi:hypothetical protein
VPQYPYFGFQPPPRPEAVEQQPDEKQANCDHQPQSCSDSVAAAIPTDGVFGSDTRKQVCDRASPLHGLAWLAAQEQHDQPGGVTRDRRKPQWEDGMRLVTLVRGITITFLSSLCPISVGHGQSPAEFYKGKNANIYILSLCQRPR